MPGVSSMKTDSAGTTASPEPTWRQENRCKPPVIPTGERAASEVEAPGAKRLERALLSFVRAANPCLPAASQERPTTHIGSLSTRSLHFARFGRDDRSREG